MYGFFSPNGEGGFVAFLVFAFWILVSSILLVRKLGRATRRRLALHPAGVEAVQRGRDEVGQRLEVVAAFEHRGDARGERRRADGELAEGALGQPELGQRVGQVRVEARRDEQQLRLERGDRVLGPLERGEVRVVARARGQRAG